MQLWRKDCGMCNSFEVKDECRFLFVWNNYDNIKSRLKTLGSRQFVAPMDTER